jgi:hypothetical protein
VDVPDDTGDMSEAEASADEAERLLEQRQFADAERCGRRAIALDPRLPRAHSVLSLILRETGGSGRPRTLRGRPSASILPTRRGIAASAQSCM